LTKYNPALFVGIWDYSLNNSGIRMEVRMSKKLFFFLIVIVSMTISLYAATLEETLQSMSNSAAKAYVNPMVTSFGSDMNGGWFHSSPKAKIFKWDLEFGIVAMGTMFNDDDKTFDVNGAFKFTREQAERLAQQYAGEDYYNALIDKIMDENLQLNINGPTITGEAYNDQTGENGINVVFISHNVTFTYNDQTMERNIPAQTIVIPFGGLLKDLPALPLAAPQLSIGTIFGTKLSFRYLPDTELTPEIGKLKYLGYGIQHNPAVWLPFKMPVDLSLSYFTQTLEIGDLVETNASNVGLNVSKTFGMKLLSMTPYAGIAAESSKMKFHYDYVTGSVDDIVPESIPVSFEVEGKNTSRITAGLSFRLALVNINFDYNIADYPSASMGVMLNLGW
jgi:hypothetical protein